MRVEQGSALCTTLVGSCGDLITLSQVPPHCGDAWSADVALQQGIYELAVLGWLNPSHGVLDLFLDGEALTPNSGLVRAMFSYGR